MESRPSARTAMVQFSDPDAPDGSETTAAIFLSDCRTSAIARFRRAHDLRTGVRTLVHTHGSPDSSTGSVVMHVHDRAFDFWQASAPGVLSAQRRFVEGEIIRVLEELAGQGLHGVMAFTTAQRALFAPDLAQAVGEALGRSSFARLGRAPKISWEGTLVEKVRPGVFTLVVSLDF